ncbi:MAG: GNAT family N-acetyltransferase [Chloroflexi bacterium]|nr:GNAT family N-acetyltransferase [Chloroflexota bacterium]
MLDMRPVTSEEFATWLSAESRAHGNRLADDSEELRPHFDLERTVAVFEEGQIVGGSHSRRVEMTLPGASTIISGVCNVSVQPTHTRRGVMTQMMKYQLDDFHDRGEPVAALFSSESIIYGRFGYGIGSLYERWKIERPHTAFIRPFECPGRVRFVDPADITKDLPEVFLRSTKDRPAMFQREPHHWQRDSQAHEHTLGGPGGLFYVAYEENGKVDGYATYRNTGTTMVVNELMAATKEATAALWRFCFDVDRISTTEALKRPVDDPLPWMLADPRRLERSTRDGVWVRLVDVPAALKLRRYLQEDSLVIEVKDEICPWNQARFELTGSPEGASCRPTDSSPDLVLSVTHLASAYTGAVSFSTLAGAGLVEERTSGALLRADCMFASRYQPWSPHNF